MEEHLFTLLSGAVSFPVSWEEHKESVGLPRVKLTKTGGNQDYFMSGKNLAMTRVQVDCFGKSAMEANETERSVRAVLDLYRGGPIHRIFVSVRPQDRTASDVGAVPHVMTIFSVHHRD